MKLNLGCGRDYRPGWTNVDIDATVEPDTILLQNVLETLGASNDTFAAVMRQLYCIAKPDAVIEIRSRHPLHRDFLDDPSCVRRVTPEILQYFDLSLGEVWKATKQPQGSLARTLDVDFETV